MQHIKSKPEENRSPNKRTHTRQLFLVPTNHLLLFVIIIVSNEFFFLSANLNAVDVIWIHLTLFLFLLPFFALFRFASLLISLLLLLLLLRLLSQAFYSVRNHNHSSCLSKVFTHIHLLLLFLLRLLLLLHNIFFLSLLFLWIRSFIFASFVNGFAQTVTLYSFAAACVCALCTFLCRFSYTPSYSAGFGILLNYNFFYLLACLSIAYCCVYVVGFFSSQISLINIMLFFVVVALFIFFFFCCWLATCFCYKCAVCMMAFNTHRVYSVLIAKKTFTFSFFALRECDFFCVCFGEAANDDSHDDDDGLSGCQDCFSTSNFCIQTMLGFLALCVAMFFSLLFDLIWISHNTEVKYSVFLFCFPKLYTIDVFYIEILNDFFLFGFSLSLSVTR